MSDRKIRLYILSAPADVAFRDGLITHLFYLLKSGAVTVLNEPRGGITSPALKGRLELAHLILVLVSPALFSPANLGAYHTLEEISKSGKIIIPIPLRACNVENTFLASLQPLSFELRPIASARDADEAWTDVTGQLAFILRDLREDLELTTQDSELWRARARPVPAFTPGSLKQGDRLDRYALISILGRDKVFTLWEAVDTVNQTRVALKVPNASLSADDRRSFRREIWALGTIDSPFVCRLVDVLVSSTFDSFVLEYLNGETLETRISRNRHLSLPELRPLIADVLEALTSVHAYGFVHRDINPSNVFIERLPTNQSLVSLSETRSPVHSHILPRTERAKLLGFGVAKITRIRSHEPTLSATGNPQFSRPGFAAPELAQTQSPGAGTVPIDHRADLFSVGALIYNALTGRTLRPWDSANQQLLPSDAGNTLPLQGFLSRALQTDPEERFASAKVMLEHWLYEAR